MAKKKKRKVAQRAPRKKVVKKAPVKKKPSMGLAIAGLIINVIILPGLGSLIGGRKRDGVIQLVLYIVGIPLMFFFLLGLPLMIAMWIWALVTGIQMIRAAA